MGWGIVEPEGPLDARVAFVGEGPGVEEMRQGRAFVGPSGGVLWQFTERVTPLRRPMIRVLNWTQSPLGKDRKKFFEEYPEQAQKETDRLLGELRELPELQLVVALGGYAVRALLPPEYNLFWANGLAVHLPEMPYTVIPVVHPAAGLHESTMLAKTYQGLKGVGEYLRTGKTWTGFKDGGADYWLSMDRDVEAVLEAGPSTAVAIDTEGTPEAPFCLSLSLEPGTSLVIYAHEKSKLRRFLTWLQRHRPLIIMHNAPWDLDVIMAMGIDLSSFGIHDTVIDARLLGDIPADLKNLTRRELGIPMQDYRAVVGPWQKKAEQEWRGRAYGEAVPQLALEQQFTPKGRPRMSGGQPVFKVTGPEVALKIKKHVERDQQLSLQEEKWAEARVGPKPGLDLKYVPPEQHLPYAGKDARATLALSPRLHQRIQDEGLGEVSKLDHAVIPMIVQMQRTGMHLDVERYHQVMGEVSARRQELQEELQDMVGQDFNPGSGDQVEKYLREHEYELTKMTKGRTRYSTDQNVLKILQERYEDTAFLDRLLEYREHAKYEDSYLLPLGQLFQESADGHRLFHRFGIPTVSGRLTGQVLTWPARTKLGRRLRSVFTAPPGKVLVSWDLSQIELRLTAAFSKDPVMTAAFVAGRDLHADLASGLFHQPYEDCLVEPGKLSYRYPSKTIHYGLLYGMTGATLYEELRGAGVTGFTLADCEKLLEDTWETYQVAGEYLVGKGRQARQKGYVTDWLGRRRWLPGAMLMESRTSRSLKWVRLEAERQAGNYDIQGGAAEIIKRAMVRSQTDVLPRVPSLRFWLQFHDELMGEMDESEYDLANELMTEALTADSDLTAPIPIETGGVKGASWAQLK
jgi:uracil-DNA glycosylase family 4